MKSWIWQFVVVAGLLAGTQSAKAGAVGLADWCINANGDTSTACNGAGSGGTDIGGEAVINLGAFDTTLEPGNNTLGSVSIAVTNATNAYYNFYADYDVDYPTEGSFLDQGGGGGLPANISGSINDPGAPNGCTGPTTPSGCALFDQFYNNNFDDLNHETVGQNSPPNVCCDVAWGLGISGVTGTGVVTFTVSDTLPATSYYLEQTNIATGNSIYLTVTSTVTAPATSGVPEPSTFGLGILSLAGGLVIWKRRRAA